MHHFRENARNKREWEQKLVYGTHFIIEWAAQHFANLDCQYEDMSPIDLQLRPEWQMPGEVSQEDGDHHAPHT